MYAFLKLIVVVTLAANGLIAGSLVIPALGSPALAQKAKPSKKPRAEGKPAPQKTGFEHQQCTVQDPCSTRNTW
jgi:hypothetical protein